MCQLRTQVCLPALQGGDMGIRLARKYMNKGCWQRGFLRSVYPCEANLE